ncbi:hypothetical protein UPYG_G00017590 [Umbra pygmaea]|uniref:Uncharacterized protein n=1 Tax=Umbra pygmaea TaxID=75934 RepID=A0ABD0Y938_UMBPY
MKVSGKTTKKPRRSIKRKTQVYSTFIYKIHKEDCGVPTVDRCLLGSSGNWRVLGRLIGYDAARLSQLNRRKVITPQEIHIAFAQVMGRLKKMQARQPGA